MIRCRNYLHVEFQMMPFSCDNSLSIHTYQRFYYLTLGFPFIMFNLLLMCRLHAYQHRIDRFLLTNVLSFLLQDFSFFIEKCPWKIGCFLEDLFLGSQWSIILGYRRLSVKFSAKKLSTTRGSNLILNQILEKMPRIL